MQVILLDKISNLGALGDEVAVKGGYGRNYLIPKGMAVSASPENRQKFEKRRAELEKMAAETLAEAQKRAEKLSTLAIKISVKASPEGKLFGSVGVQEIAKAIKEAGCEIRKKEVHMPEGPIRQTGEYEVGLSLHSDVQTILKVDVVTAE